MGTKTLTNNTVILNLFQNPQPTKRLRVILRLRSVSKPAMTNGGNSGLLLRYAHRNDERTRKSVSLRFDDNIYKRIRKGLIMKKIRFGYIAFVLLVVFASCTKDKKTLTENTWLVDGIRMHADSAWVPNYIYIFTSLSFIEDKYILQSDADCIIGRVKIGKKDINFEYSLMSPTSKSAKICDYLLGTCIKYYEISGDKLTLTGDNGEIIKFNKKNFLKK